MERLKFVIGILLLMGVTACNSDSASSTHVENLSQAQIDSLKRIECDSLLRHLNETGSNTFKREPQIPNTLEECLTQLDTLANEEIKNWIRCLPDGKFGSYVHHSYGMYLRNNWGLWGSSTLATNLSKMGILHPDDMSSIILDSYQRRLKGEDIKLDEQLKSYQDYWRDKGLNVDSILNELGKIK